MNIKMFYTLPAIILLLSACGGGGGGSKSQSPSSNSGITSTAIEGAGLTNIQTQPVSAPKETSVAGREENTEPVGYSSDVRVGTLFSELLSGVRYQTESLSGLTGASGEFYFRKGESVTFSVGDLELGTTAAKPFVSLFDVANVNDVNSQPLRNIVRLIYSLDEDDDLRNGVAISELAGRSASEIDFLVSKKDFESSIAVTNLVANSGSKRLTLLGEAIALQYFTNALRRQDAAALVINADPDAGEDSDARKIFFEALEENPSQENSIEHQNKTCQGSHSNFGSHLTQVFDTRLKKNVFKFLMHLAEDVDCASKLTDRQRLEIKVYDDSPDALKGFEGDFQTFSWKLKLDSNFAVSKSFTHLFQVSSIMQSTSMPLITITARAGVEDKLQVVYHEPNSANSNLTSGALRDFLGRWLHINVRFKNAGESGYFEITISDDGSGKELLSFSHNNLNLFPGETRFTRTKWGINRFIEGVELDLRDEALFFSDFCFTKGVYSCAGPSADEKPNLTISDELIPSVPVVTPMPTPMPTPTSTGVAEPAPTVAPTPDATLVPTAVPTPIAEPAPVTTPMPSAIPVPSLEPTPIAPPVPTAEPTPIVVPVPTTIPIPTLEPSLLITPTPIVVPAPTVEPTPASTPIPVIAPSPTELPQPTFRPTFVPMPAPTAEPVLVPPGGFVPKPPTSPGAGPRPSDLRGYIPVHYYAFNGTNLDLIGALDLQEKGVNGFTDAVSIQDRAKQFTGAGYLESTSSAYSFAPGREMSLELWLNMAELPSNMAAALRLLEAAAGDGSRFGFVLQVNAQSKQVEFVIHLGEGKSFSIRSTDSLEKNKWHHIVVTQNRDFIELHVDGMLSDFEIIEIETIAPDLKIDSSLVLGADAGEGAGAFVALIDEFSIWDVELTPFDIIVRHAEVRSGISAP